MGLPSHYTVPDALLFHPFGSYTAPYHNWLRGTMTVLCHREGAINALLMGRLPPPDTGRRAYFNDTAGRQ